MINKKPAPEGAIREPTLAETLDRFIVACQRVHTLAEQTQAAIAAWNRRVGGEQEAERESIAAWLDDVASGKGDVWWEDGQALDARDVLDRLASAVRARAALAGQTDGGKE